MRTPLDGIRVLDFTRALAERCDLVVENLRPGVMARLELSYENLSVRNPAIILCSISDLSADPPEVERTGEIERCR